MCLSTLCNSTVKHLQKVFKEIQSRLWKEAIGKSELATVFVLGRYLLPCSSVINEGCQRKKRKASQLAQLNFHAELSVWWGQTTFDLF